MKNMKRLMASLIMLLLCTLNSVFPSKQIEKKIVYATFGPVPNVAPLDCANPQDANIEAPVDLSAPFFASGAIVTSALIAPYLLGRYKNNRDVAPCYVKGLFVTYDDGSVTLKKEGDRYHTSAELLDARRKREREAALRLQRARDAAHQRAAAAREQGAPQPNDERLSDEDIRREVARIEQHYQAIRNQAASSASSISSGSSSSNCLQPLRQETIPLIGYDPQNPNKGFNPQEETDSAFTLDTFADLISAQQAKGLPYILARVTSQTTSRPTYFDAQSLNHYIFRGYPIYPNQSKWIMSANNELKHKIEDVDQGFMTAINPLNREPFRGDTIDYFVINSLDDKEFTYLASFIDLITKQPTQHFFYGNNQ